MFGVVKFVKNAHIDKFKILSFSVHVDNEKKDILIFGEGPTQGLDDTTLTAKKSIQLILQNLEISFV